MRHSQRPPRPQYIIRQLQQSRQPNTITSTTLYPRSYHFVPANARLRSIVESLSNELPLGLHHDSKPHIHVPGFRYLGPIYTDFAGFGGCVCGVQSQFGPVGFPFFIFIYCGLENANLSHISPITYPGVNNPCYLTVSPSETSWTQQNFSYTSCEESSQPTTHRTTHPYADSLRLR